MEVPKATVVAETGGGNARAIVLYRAVPAAIVDRDVDLGRSCIQRVLEQAADRAVQRRDVGRGLDLRNDVPGKRLYRHGARGLDISSPASRGGWLWLLQSLPQQAVVNWQGGLFIEVVKTKQSVSSPGGKKKTKKKKKEKKVLETQHVVMVISGGGTPDTAQLMSWISRFQVAPPSRSSVQTV